MAYLKKNQLLLTRFAPISFCQSSIFLSESSFNALRIKVYPIRVRKIMLKL